MFNNIWGGGAPSSALGALSTLVTIGVLYWLTRATLMSPGKDETRVCGYVYIYIYIHMHIYIYINIKEQKQCAKRLNVQ